MPEEKKDGKFGNAARFRRKVDWKKTDHVIQDRSKGSNNPKWYFKGNEDLAKDVASLSYNTRVGQEVNDINVENPLVYTEKFNTAGICVLNWMPSLGVNDSDLGNVSQAQFGYYANVRSANSGAGNYESADMFAYTVALANLYAAYFCMRRIYGIAQLAGMRNNYLGSRSLLYAMGVDPDSVQSNLPKVRADINLFVTKLSNFALPNNIDLVRRWCFMSDNIYSDSSDIGKSQYYLYNMAYMFKYDWDKAGGTALEMVSTGLGQTRAIDSSGVITVMSLNTWDDIYACFLEGIQRMTDVTDVSIISGDILKRYGDSEIFGVETIPEDYTVFPIYDEEVLEQIHNADIPYVQKTENIVGYLPNNTSQFTETNSIIQDNNILIAHPQLITDAAANKTKCILNSRFRSPTVEDNFVNTRLKFTCSKTGKLLDIISCGSELITHAYIIAKPYNSTYEYKNLVYPIGTNMIVNLTELTNLAVSDELEESLVYYTLNGLAYLQQFDWHMPYRVEYVFTPLDGTVPKFAQTQVAGDLANFVILEDSTLENINYCALLSLFNVLPDTGRII